LRRPPRPPGGGTLSMSARDRHVVRAVAAVARAAIVAATMGCSETRNVGTSAPHGRLPAAPRNPIRLVNARAPPNSTRRAPPLPATPGGRALAGIVVATSPNWPTLDTNITGWRDLISAARASGLRDLPDPTASVGAPLARPPSGAIADTAPNRSEGARLLLET